MWLAWCWCWSQLIQHARQLYWLALDWTRSLKIFASVVVVWQLTGVNLHRERFALRLIGSAFIALVLYIVAQLLYTFLSGTHPATSLVGILWIGVTFVAMLLLAFGKRVTGQQLKNEVLLTEGRVTLVDAYSAELSWWVCCSTLFLAGGGLIRSRH